MPIPRSLFDRSAPADHDLTVRRRRLAGRPHRRAGDQRPAPRHLRRPAPVLRRGHDLPAVAPAGHATARPATPSPGASARIDSPSARLRAEAARRVHRHDDRRAVALRRHQRRQHRAAAVGRPALHDVGRRPAGGDRPGDRSASSARSATAPSGPALEVYPQPVLPLVMSTAHPVIDPDRERALDGQHPLRASCTSSAGTATGPVQLVADRRRDDPAVGPHDHPDPRLAHRRRLRLQGRAAGVLRRRPHRARQPRRARLPHPQGRPARGHAARARRSVRSASRSRRRSTTTTRPTTTATASQVLFEHTENADIAMTQGEGDLDALGRPCDPALRGLYGFPMSPDRTTMVALRPRARARVTHRAELRDPQLLWTRQLNAMDWSTEGRTRPDRAPHGLPGLATRGHHPEDAGPLRRPRRPHAVARPRRPPPLVVDRVDARPRASRAARAGARRLPVVADLRAAGPGRRPGPQPLRRARSRAATTATWSCR